MKTINQLKNGEGGIVEVNSQEVAVYKNEEGEILKMSPLCPHQGCTVEWNQSQKTWDCPCHGARFAADGKLMQGPATRDLEKILE